MATWIIMDISSHLALVNYSSKFALATGLAFKASMSVLTL